MTKEMHRYPYPRALNTVDALVFRLFGPEVEILLIERSKEPFQGHWAFPGGYVEMEEDLELAARRELAEETKLKLDTMLPLGVFGRVDRDPRGRTITAAFYHLLHRLDQSLEAQSDAAQLKWFSIEHLPALAFDHGEILHYAFPRIYKDLLYAQQLEGSFASLSQDQLHAFMAHFKRQL